MKRRTLCLLGALLAIAPTCVGLRPAFADDDEPQGDEGATPTPMQHRGPRDPRLIAEVRAKALREMTTNDTVLINVTAEELPATPDVYNLGKKTTAALIRCVADNVDDNARVLCADILGKMGDKRALAALHGALEAWNSTVRRSAIIALGNMPDPSSIDPLIKIAQRKDEDGANVDAALRALGAMSHSKAAAELERAYRDPRRVQYNVTALRAIFRSRSVLARSTLIADVELALAGDDGLALEGLRMAIHLRDPAFVSALQGLMTHTNVQVRNRAVYALGKIGDRRATNALVNRVPEVRESRMLNNIAFALERLDAAQFARTVEPLAKHSQATIRLNTAYVIGDVGRKEGVPLLATALADKNDAVRISAVAALGKIDAPQAATALEGYLKDPNSHVREEATFGLFRVTGNTRADLLVPEYLAAPSTHTRAVFALARAKDPRILDDALAIGFGYREFDALFRTQKPETVGPRALIEWAQGVSEAAPYVAALKPDGSAPLVSAFLSQSISRKQWSAAMRSATLLSDLGDPRQLPAAQALVGSEKTMARMQGFVSSVRLGKRDEATKFWSEWENLPRARLAVAGAMLAEIEEPEARTAFTRELDKRKSSVDRLEAVIAISVQCAWNAEAGVLAMVESLASISSEEREASARSLIADRRDNVTSLLRKALTRESRPIVRNALSAVLDVRRERFATR